MLSGLVVGRFHHLASPSFNYSPFIIRPGRIFRKSIYRTIVVLIALIPLTYFISVGLSFHSYMKGVKRCEKAISLAPMRLFVRPPASGERPYSLIHPRRSYRQALQRLTPDQKENREALYQKSFALLADAETKNTYRPKIYAIRGLLISENPDLAGKDWQNKASKAFRNALKVILVSWRVAWIMSLS